MKNLFRNLSTSLSFLKNNNPQALPAYMPTQPTIRPNHKRNLMPLFLLIFLVLMIIVVILYLNKAKPAQKITQANYGNFTNEVPSTKEKQIVNKSYAISLNGNSGSQTNKVKYIIESVELMDEILVKGQRVRTVNGKTFLIINLKLQNNSNKTIEVNSRDYIRLITDNANEQLAADVHSDPVLVQAISTKPTRLGFPIKDTDKNLTLRVGEIEGEKKNVPIHFK